MQDLVRRISLRQTVLTSLFGIAAVLIAGCGQQLDEVQLSSYTDSTEAASLSTAATTNEIIFNQYFPRIIEAADSIYENGQPTGRLTEFRGSGRTFTSTQGGLNQPDIRFGRFLYSIYDMYCAKGDGRLNCKPNLRVRYSLRGNSGSVKLMTVSVNGASFTSQYYQEVIKEMWSQLRAQYGQVGFSNEQLAHITPGRMPVLRSHFFILRASSGEFANQIWTNHEMHRKFSQHIQQQLQNVIAVYPTFETFTNDQYWNMEQNQLLHASASQYSRSGQVSAVISSPHRRSSMGYAFIDHSSRPFFIFRLWDSSHASGLRFLDNPADIRQNARIWIHELGHQMNLRHNNPNSLGVHTDNLWTHPQGPKYVYDRMSNYGLLRAGYAF